MTEDDKLAIALHRASQAEQLLSSELLTEQFDYLKTEYIAAWQRSAALDVARREKLWQAVNVVGLVQEHLRTILNGGKLAAAELEMRHTKRR